MSFNRTVIFIDGSNVYAASKKLGIDIDYKRLLKYYGDDLIRAYYYTAVIEDATEYVSIKPLLDWLSYNGYKLVTKPAKTFIDPVTGLTKVKGNMDGELIVDAMELIPHIDRMILFSGDGDFECLIHAMQRKGVKCDVVSTLSMCADELRRAADEFIDLVDLKESIARRPEDKRASRYG
jgi:uncharacterized LabA/DUF88 family protein